MIRDPPATSGEFATVPIIARHVKAGFRCGSAPLDEFFAKHALPNDRRGIGKTFVLERPEGQQELPEVVGFYTLSMAVIAYGELPTPKRKALPKYPMPVALVGRLAIDDRARGRGYGERLLVDALRRILSAADQLGCFGVVVDAKDANARSFYSKYDFQPIEGAKTFPLRMFVSIETVRAAE